VLDRVKDKVKASIAEYCGKKADAHIDEAEWRTDNYPVNSYGWEVAEVHLAFAELWMAIGKVFLKGS
jgi:hypothetical protein